MDDGYTSAERDELIALFRGRPVSRFWITQDGDGVRLTGFLANADVALAELGMLVNGHIVRKADWKRWKPAEQCGPDDFRALPWWPGMKGYGFDIYFFFDEIVELGRMTGYVKVEISTMKGTPLCAPAQAIYLPAQDAADKFSSVRPPAHLMQRVMGRENPTAEWYMTGYTNLRVFDDIAFETTQSTIAMMGPILEWGTGCGRLARHLLRLPNTAFVGIDIDREAMAWCNDHLAKGHADARFEPCGLLPPTDLPSESFGLAIGISVITHLNEPIGNAWLAELCRVLRPGGLLLLTVHGFQTFYVDHGPELFRALRDQGTYSIKSGLLNVLLGDHQEYYRESWHSEAYIRANWSQWFDVLDVRRGGHMGYQDLVVLRRR